MIRDVLRSQSLRQWVEDIIGMTAVAVLVGIFVVVGMAVVPG